MTMRELARLANVSVSTVSKAFHDADDVSPETKEHIFSIARQYGCYGKFYKGKFYKKVIAIICPELASSYYISFVERLQQILEEHDCFAIVSADHFSPTKQAEIIEYYASYLQVDGIVVFALRTALKQGYECPIVSVFPAVTTTLDCVDVRLDVPIADAVDLLYRLGHRHIGFIGERLTRRKSQHFGEAVARYPDIHATVVQNQYRFEQCGQAGVDALLAQDPQCTAILCAYDNIAFGAMRQLKLNGLRVPEDVSMIGMDNLQASQYRDIPLASVETDPAELCMLVWDLLHKKLESKFYHSSQRILITGRLIPRESVAQAPRQPE